MKLINWIFINDAVLYQHTFVQNLNLHMFLLFLKELGFPFVELNASDQRNKKSLKEDVAASVQNTSLSNLFGAGVSCGCKLSAQLNHPLTHATSVRAIIFCLFLYLKERL